MTYANKPKHAGARPFEPEHNRDDIEHHELELLEQDETYRRLAEVRWLVDELEIEVAGNTDIPEATRAHLFRAVADTDSPLTGAVDHYVDAWLAEFRGETA